jgi:hypothetical protein
MTKSAAKYGDRGNQVFFDPLGGMQNHAHNACMAQPYDRARNTSFVLAQT